MLIQEFNFCRVKSAVKTLMFCNGTNIKSVCEIKPLIAQKIWGSNINIIFVSGMLNNLKMVTDYSKLSLCQ